MVTQDIENLIVKYLINEASSMDLDLLSKWIENPDNESFFEAVVKTHYEVTLVMNQPDVDSIKRNLLKKIKKDKNLLYRLNIQKVFKYAAVAVFFLSIGYFFQKDFFSGKSSNETAMPKEEFITLQLEDGNIKVISQDGSAQVLDSKGNIVGKQKGNRLIYNDGSALERIVYNTLRVPYGKRFEILLSDGTKAYLNAGSSLKYPIKFLEGEKRQVYLTGEAFLDVAKDNDHPFIVNAGDLKIRVLGTQFNVSTYPEDKTSEVVLVEGLLELYLGSKDYRVKNSTILKPGFKGSYNKKDSEVTTKPVITSIYTSWINGELVFRNMTFENILKKLERHYNVTIDNRNVELSLKEFNANFGSEPIKNVLEELKVNYGIKYEISDTNKIIIE